MHFYFYYAVAAAPLASAARNVERKPARLISAFARVGRSGVQFADRCKRARLSRGVTPRRSAYGALVYCYNVIEIIHALNILKIAYAHLRAVQSVGKHGQ